MERLRIIIEKTMADRFIEGLVYAGVIATWVYPLLMFNYLPEIIPSHFNAAGQVGGYSNINNIR
jgi:hypothetical protein